jgi:hypothetical protein
LVIFCLIFARYAIWGTIFPLLSTFSGNDLISIETLHYFIKIRI